MRAEPAARAVRAVRVALPGHLARLAAERAPNGAMRLRPYLRVFAASADLTPAGLGAPLPPEVRSGSDALRIVGAIAGG